ncbi:MAG: HAD family hydrolase [Bacteroidota bacterium]
MSGPLRTYVTATLLIPGVAPAADSLRSWNSGPVKTAIVQFVRDVSTEGGPHYVPPPERIAVFRDDGTLCSELPFPAQVAYVLDRVKSLARKHPRWKSKEPFRSALARNPRSLAAAGTRGLLELMAAAHAGMTTGEFEAAVQQWLTKARNPRLHRLYSQSAFQPMIELLAHLHAYDFKVFVVSNGDAAFLRSWSEQAYGIPPERIIGGQIKTKLVLRKGEQLLVRLNSFEVPEGKLMSPGTIYRTIGRKPIAAFGNSDDDLDVLQWVASGPNRSLALIVHHTDSGNEFAYDRSATFGRLDKALAVAKKQGWLVADMTKDWSNVFPKSSR